jgi:SAM-dependent MidA family methyltransferase
MGVDYRAQILAKNATPKQRIDLETAIDRLVSPKQMGNLFKVLQLFTNIS